MAKNKKKFSRMRLKVEGAEQVVQAMQRADKAIRKQLHDLISEAAELVFREADARAPIGPTGRTRFSLRIEIGTSKRGNFYANVVVGAQDGESTKTSAFYVTFYELGSSRQPARPFLRPALDKCRPRIRRMLQEGLAKIVNSNFSRG